MAINEVSEVLGFNTWTSPISLSDRPSGRKPFQAWTLRRLPGLTEPMPQGIGEAWLPVTDQADVPVCIVMPAQATVTEYIDLEAYLGSADGVLARTADAIVVVDKEELPVHMTYLCHGALQEAVLLGLNQDPRQKPLQIPVPGCRAQDFVQFLRVLYSLSSEKIAEAMTLEQLQTAGLVADRLGYRDTLREVEVGLLSKVCGVGAGWTIPHNSIFYITAAKATHLMEWAATVGSIRIAMLCGAYMGINGVQANPNAMAACVQTAMFAVQNKYAGSGNIVIR